MASEFSRTLSLLRQERGVSQRTAAGDLGISQALLSHYENGIREPGLLFVVTALRSIGEGLWFVKYQFTLLPAALACPVLLALGFVVPRAVYALRKKESVVEEIRE